MQRKERGHAIPRVVHFEISADEPERTVKFYTSVFEWTVNKWEGPMDYWLLTTGRINLALTEQS